MHTSHQTIPAKFTLNPWNATRLRLVMAISLSVGTTLFAGCAATRNAKPPSGNELARADMATPTNATPAASVPTRVSEALAEPVVVAPVTPEPRLDLLVNNAQARDVFLALVADSRYSMLMHPDVSGTLSVTLRGVTVQEALESIRDVYGYDFKMEGRRITVYAPTLQTRIFTVNYPNSQRQGMSDLRVSAGLVASSGGSTSGNSNGASNVNNLGSNTVPGPGAGANNSQQTESSRISTSSRSDFWAELTEAVKGMVGKGEGRSVFTSPQAGIMAVKAMPEELRQVDKFLKAARISVERQVMLEAKIVQVELSDGYQSGIDWSGLRNVGKTTGAIGVTGGGSNNVLTNGALPNLPGFAATSGTPLLADNVPLPTTGGGMFGLALATTGFQAVLGFLETRGDVQILSSPRIATLNNQKAVLKVGTDAYFVTNVSGGNAAATTGVVSTAPTMPSLTLTPFFSGIALDVTPQIDEANNITLHIHPSVTTVTEVVKQINLGAAGNYQIPLPSSSVNESDTMVRLLDGNIVAIGGLMQVESSRTSSGMPGSTDVPFFSSLLGNRANTTSKKELVVLIKPSIVRTAQDWEQQTHHVQSGVEELDNARNRVIRLDGGADSTRKPAAAP